MLVKEIVGQAKNQVPGMPPGRTSWVPSFKISTNYGVPLSTNVVLLLQSPFGRSTLLIHEEETMQTKPSYTIAIKILFTFIMIIYSYQLNAL